VVRGGQQAVSREKAFQKLYDILRMKNKPIQVCVKLPSLVCLQQKVDELILSTSSCSTIIILDNDLN
jgi:hypothetical protein